MNQIITNKDIMVIMKEHHISNEDVACAMGEDIEYIQNLFTFKIVEEASEELQDAIVGLVELDEANKNQTEEEAEQTKAEEATSNELVKRPPALMLYYDLEPVYNSLNDAQMGAGVKALLRFGNTGKEQEIKDPMIKMLYDLVKPKIIENQKKYEKTCERNKRNASRK